MLFIVVDLDLKEDLRSSYLYKVAGHFKLSGADNPGIVHKFTSVLARNNLTIGNMKTSQEEAPFGGTELFTSKYSDHLFVTSH